LGVWAYARILEFTYWASPGGTQSEADAHLAEARKETARRLALTLLGRSDPLTGSGQARPERRPQPGLPDVLPGGAAVAGLADARAQDQQHLSSRYAPLPQPAPPNVPATQRKSDKNRSNQTSHRSVSANGMARALSGER